MRILTFMTVLLLAGAIVVLTLRGRNDTAVTETLRIADVLADEHIEGYARAMSPREFTFPADHGPHRDFKTEWWYVTGNLAAASGQRFGFQLTFFRSALQPEDTAGASSWRTSEIFMAHFAVTDVRGQRFHAYERFARVGNGLAGARGTPVRVWLDDWFMVIDHPGNVPMITLAAGEDGVRVDLQATSDKPPVLQGDAGLSQKGSQPGNASYYYSLTRMTANGTLALPGREFEVWGSMWLDREWSTSALEKTQAGWDWFSIQLDDGFDLMYYQMRNTNGTAGSTSRGALIDPAGEKSDIRRDDVTIEVLDHWASPRGGDYPSRWRFRDRRHDVDVELVALVADQEFARSFRYWEGAVRVRGTRAGKRITGVGYVELTGYTGNPLSLR